MRKLQNISPKIETVPKSKSPYIYDHNRTENSFYCVTGGGSEWTDCREVFHQYSDNDRKFFYRTRKLSSIARMYDWVERTINLKPKYRTKIHKTDNSRIICVNLSPFWVSCDTRWGLATVLIRVACYRSKNDKHPLDMILSDKTYGSGAALAIAKFLSGYTECSIDDYNFVDELTVYDPLSFEQTKQSLNKPTDCSFFVKNNPKSNLSEEEVDRLLNWVNGQIKEFRFGNAIDRF